MPAIEFNHCPECNGELVLVSLADRHEWWECEDCGWVDLEVYEHVPRRPTETIRSPLLSSEGEEP